MHARKRPRLKTHSATAHLSKPEYDLLTATAAGETMTLSDYARRELLGAVCISQQEWRVLTFQVVAEEAARLRFERAQRGEDIATVEIRLRIEDEALANAESIVMRRLELMKRRNVRVGGSV